MRFLRWLMLSSCLGCLLLVAWRPDWVTRLDAPGSIPMLVHHGAIAPLWAPPTLSLPQVLQELGRDSEWHAVAPASITFRTGPDWGRVLGMLWHLLLPALLVPGWIYWRVRGREHDRVLHVGSCCGVLLALPIIAAYAWLLLGGL